MKLIIPIFMGYLFILSIKDRVGEIPLRREISTSHTTVRTVPYTAVQST